MKRYRLLFVTLICLFVCGPILAQTTQPKIIDGHLHYNGDPAFLQKLLVKLESVDGMAFLLVPPSEMDTASESPCWLRRDRYGQCACT
jgi:uncharacterized protein